MKIPAECNQRVFFKVVSVQNLSFHHNYYEEHNRVLNHENGILLNKLVEISQGK